MNGRWGSTFICGLLLAGCAGIDQFPDSAADTQETLVEVDRDFCEAYVQIYGGSCEVPATGSAAGSTASTSAEGGSGPASATPGASAPPPPLDAKKIRNGFIEKRIAVIDAYFEEYIQALAKGNARADLGVGGVDAVVDAAGTLIAGPASQVLSAVSGGLGGVKAQYDKAVLYDQALPALMAQMQAGRDTIRARILQRWSKDIDSYPLWLARSDLQEYQFAGSIPGAIKATAASAKEQSQAAEQALFATISPGAASPEAFTERADIVKAIDALDADKAKALVPLIKAGFAASVPFIEAQYPEDDMAADVSGEKAKTLLKRLVPLTAKEAADRQKWRAAMAGLAG